MTSNPQTEARAIVRWTRDAAGWVEWPDGEWVRYSDHTTALAAKDAELAEVRQQYVDANEARIDAEAQLAGARKALADIRSEAIRCRGEQSYRNFASFAARRAREQGGENNG